MKLEHHRPTLPDGRAVDVALARLEAGKANAMSDELVAGLDRLVDEIEASHASAAVITGYGKYFSAGLALPTLIDRDREQMRAFMDGFARVMMRLFCLDIPLVAAINGHAIAGGCVLALMADERLCAQRDAKIGLNEVQIGIGLPPIVVEPLRLSLPWRSVLRVAVEGRLFSPGEALKIGLVDGLVAPDALEERSLARAAALGSGEGAAVAQVKRALRGPTIERLEETLLHSDPWLDTWFAEPAQRRLREVVEKLGG